MGENKMKTKNKGNFVKAGIAITLAILLTVPITLGTKNGNTLDEIIYVPGDYPTIQAGINHANNGDIVYVSSGTYLISSPIVIDRSIVVAGEDRDTTNILANPSMTNMVQITANGVSFQWFSLLWNAGTPPMNSVPILVTSQQNHIFGNNIFADDSRSAIELTSTSGNTVIADNHIFNPYSDCLRLTASDDNIIDANTFRITSPPERTDPVYYDRAIIRAFGSSGNEIQGNTLGNDYDFYDGIDLETYWQSNPILFCTGNAIIGNTISGHGVFGLYLNSIRANTISGNIITGKSDGIYLVGDDYYAGRIARNNTFTGNTITGTGQGEGLFLWLALSNTFVGNTVQSNTEGIRIEPYSAFNHFYQNKFQNNQQNAFLWNNDQSTWDGGYLYGGNYWSDHPAFIDEYCGPNQDAIGSDGICDTPYNVDRPQIQDHYPLMSPQTNEYVETIRGTVSYINLEGGFYGIVADDGRHFDPYNMPNTYRIHGLNIEFSGRIISVIGPHMWGQTVYFTSLRQIGQVHDESYLSCFYEGVYKSLYGGTSWFPVNTGLPANRLTYCLAGGREAGLAQGELYVGTQSGVYKTMNGGGSWVLDGLAGQKIRDFDIVPQTHRVYAATNHGLYTRDPATHEWTLVAFFHEADDPRVPLTAVDVLHVSVCYANPNIIYIAGCPFGILGTWVYKSIDSGVTWDPGYCLIVEQPFYPAHPTELAVNRFNENYAYTGAIGDEDILHCFWRTTDGSVTWQGGPVDFLSTKDLITDPVRNGVVYLAANTPNTRTGKCISKSTDNGNTWTTLSTWGFGDAFLATHPYQAGTLYCGLTTLDENTGHACFGKTTDNGQTWGFFHQGLPSYENMIPRLTGFVVDLPTTPVKLPIEILKPVTAEKWKVGSTQLIQWQSQKGVADKVTISLSVDSGATWTKIGSSLNAAGLNTFKWTVSGKFVSTHCRIKVEDAKGKIPSTTAIPYDISLGDFIIQ
jgi:parallel beta-helix repeat protein